MRKCFCMKCGEEVEENTKECKCGGSTFIIGDVIKIDKGFKCKCGGDSFNSNMHMDFTDKAITNYVCANCGNAIATVYYRDKEDMMYYED